MPGLAPFAGLPRMAGQQGQFPQGTSIHRFADAKAGPAPNPYLQNLRQGTTVTTQAAQALQQQQQPGGRLIKDPNALPPVLQSMISPVRRNTGPLFKMSWWERMQKLAQGMASPGAPAPVDPAQMAPSAASAAPGAADPAAAMPPPFSGPLDAFLGPRSELGKAQAAQEAQAAAMTQPPPIPEPVPDQAPPPADVQLTDMAEAGRLPPRAWEQLFATQPLEAANSFPEMKSPLDPEEVSAAKIASSLLEHAQRQKLTGVDPLMPNSPKGIQHMLAKIRALRQQQAGSTEQAAGLAPASPVSPASPAPQSIPQLAHDSLRTVQGRAMWRPAALLGALGGAGLGGALYGAIAGAGAGAERGQILRGAGRGLMRGGLTGGGAGLGAILGGALGSATGNRTAALLGALGGAGLGGASGWLGSGLLLGEPERDPETLQRHLEHTQKSGSFPEMKTASIGIGRPNFSPTPKSGGGYLKTYGLGEAPKKPKIVHGVKGGWYAIPRSVLRKRLRDNTADSEFKTAFARGFYENLLDRGWCWPQVEEAITMLKQATPDLVGELEADREAGEKLFKSAVSLGPFLNFVRRGLGAARNMFGRAAPAVAGAADDAAAAASAAAAKAAPVVSQAAKRTVPFQYATTISRDIGLEGMKPPAVFRRGFRTTKKMPPSPPSSVPHSAVPPVSPAAGQAAGTMGQAAGQAAPGLLARAGNVATAPVRGVKSLWNSTPMQMARGGIGGTARGYGVGALAELVTGEGLRGPMGLIGGTMGALSRSPWAQRMPGVARALGIGSKGVGALGLGALGAQQILGEATAGQVPVLGPQAWSSPPQSGRAPGEAGLPLAQDPVNPDNIQQPMVRPVSGGPVGLLQRLGQKLMEGVDGGGSVLKTIEQQLNTPEGQRLMDQQFANHLQREYNITPGQLKTMLQAGDKGALGLLKQFWEGLDPWMKVAVVLGGTSLVGGLAGGNGLLAGGGALAMLLPFLMPFIQQTFGGILGEQQGQPEEQSAPPAVPPSDAPPDLPPAELPQGLPDGTQPIPTQPQQAVPVPAPQIGPPQQQLVPAI